MAQYAAPNNRRMPAPKELDKAFRLSADRASLMAEAFELKVPGVATKPEKARGSAEVIPRAQKT